MHEIGQGSSLMLRDFRRILCATAWLAIVCCLSASAEVRLSNLFSDHAVLQRGRPVRVWGWAESGERVSVRFHEQSRETVADSYGAWEVWLQPESAGGPYTLAVSGSQTAKPIERGDILVGDVWVASGQSNMEFPLKGFGSTMPLKNQAQEIAAANHPRIRLFLVKRAVSLWPLDSVNGAWSACTPEAAADFSAVAYFFGREISERENVPVGLIDSTVGGTPALSWISLEGLGANSQIDALRNGVSFVRDQALASAEKENFAAQDAALKAQDKPIPARPRVNDYQGAKSPAVLYNGMIAPLTRYAIKGVIWYQGETDSAPERGPNYARLFSALITDWRRQWAQGDFPFLFVQISSFGSKSEIWGQVRDAQRQTLALRNTGMAVSLDVGDAANVHPADKQSVGDRLAAIALGSVYGETVNFAGPEFAQATTEGKLIRVWLEHADGLTARNQPLGDFELAGADHVFKPAEAKIETVVGKTTILVYSYDVPQPRYVRYGWSNVVTHYLYNGAGFPLGTFTTDTE